MAERAVTVPGHFGEWLQGRLGPDGPVALITLMPGGPSLRATHRPGAGCVPELATIGCALPVSGAGAAALLAALDLRLGGCITFDPAFAPGLGTGMSTAALIALARLAGYRGAPEPLARACIAAEGASDPLMFPAPDRLLWTSREGDVVTRFTPPPPVHLVAGFFGPPQPTDARDSDYDDISDLATAWGRRDDAPWRASLAAESAHRCLVRRGPADDPMPDLARDLRALGWAMSHSGAARALIFAPDAAPRHGMAALTEAGLTEPREFAPCKENV